MKHIVMELDDQYIHIYAADEEIDGLVAMGARHRGEALVGPYTFYKHGPHTNPGQPHLHIYKKQNELFSINMDGTAHDQSHGYEIPGKVFDALRDRFPNWQLPADRRIAYIAPLTGPVFQGFLKIAAAAEPQELVELQELLKEFEGGH